MSFFDWAAKLLSASGIKASAKDIALFKNIHITINIGTKTTTTNEKKTLFIGYPALSEEEKDELLLKDIPQQFKGGTPVLEQNFYESIYKYKEIISINENKDFISYFTGKIPNEDIIILKASIYLKNVLISGGDSNTIKQDIIQKYGTRGKNISNLYTAGYFSSWIKPLYEELSKSSQNPSAAKEKFIKIYQEIVRCSPFAVFIHRSMTPLETKREIENKISHLKKYGIKTLNVHAIGHKNISTVKAVIKKIEKSIKFKKEVEKDGEILVIKLTIE